METRVKLFEDGEEVKITFAGSKPRNGWSWIFVSY
jgi:hypothetical protein